MSRDNIIEHLETAEKNLSAIENKMAILGGMLTERDSKITELEARVSELENLLSDAVDDIESWGGYASAYFQDKHGLKQDIAKYRAAITPPRGNV